MFLFDEMQPKEVTWREKYNSVIKSVRWKKIRARFCAKHYNACQNCGWLKQSYDKSRKLELHHITYERLGCELDADLVLLCTWCHVKADIERAKINRKNALERFEESLYDAQFEGWASKVYGEDYYMFEDERMHEKFADWVDMKESSGGD